MPRWEGSSTAPSSSFRRAFLPQAAFAERGDARLLRHRLSIYICVYDVVRVDPELFEFEGSV